MINMSFRKISSKALVGLLIFSILVFLPGINFAYEKTDIKSFTEGEDKIAVLFGMSDYSGSYLDISAPTNDIITMKSLLEYDGYTVYTYENISEADAKANINAAFTGSSSEDTLLFYFEGHGAVGSESTLMFTDTSTNSYMYVSELASTLDAFEGTKVVLLDCCYSGGFIDREISTEEIMVNDTEEINQNIINTFEALDSQTGEKALNTSEYKVLTSSAGEQSSWMSSINGSMRGYFSHYYTKGCGYYNDYSPKPADINGDGKISQEEIYYYTHDIIEEIGYLPNHVVQSVQAYPCETGDADFIIFGDISLPDINNLSVSPETGNAGDTYTTTLITDNNVDKIAFYSEGTYHSQLFANSSGVTVMDNGDGTATWTISKIIGKTGERTFSYKTHNEAGWSGLNSVSFTVQGITVPVINSLSISPDSGQVGSLFTTTLLTDDSVEKIAFYSDGTYHSQLFTNSSGVTVTDNGDGTATWTITKKIGRIGERTFSYKTHNKAGWSEMVSFNFTVIEIKPPVIDSLSINPVSGQAGEKFTATLITNENVDKIAFYSEGVYHSQLFASSSGVTVSDNGDGTVTWTITKKIGRTGDRTFSYKAHNKGGWSEISSVNFSVY